MEQVFPLSCLLEIYSRQGKDEKKLFHFLFLETSSLLWKFILFLLEKKYYFCKIEKKINFRRIGIIVIKIFQF